MADLKPWESEHFVSKWEDADKFTNPAVVERKKEAIAKANAEAEKK
jgi:hypothetical protein